METLQRVLPILTSRCEREADFFFFLSSTGIWRATSSSVLLFQQVPPKDHCKKMKPGRDGKKRNRNKLHVRHYFPPITRNQTAKQEKLLLELPQLFSGTDIRRVTSLFRSTNGGQKRKVLVKSSKLDRHLTEERGLYAVPLASTDKITPPVTSVSTSGTRNTRRTLDSRNNLKFQATNNLATTKYRSRSPLKVQTIVKPQEFKRRISGRSHGSAELSEKDKTGFARMSLRQDKPLKPAELSPFGKRKWAKQQEMVKTFRGDHCEEINIHCKSPTADVAELQFVGTLVKELFPEMNLPKKSNFCNNAVDPTKPCNFPLSFEFRVSVPREVSVASIGIQAPDTNAEEIGKEGKINGIDSFALNLSCDKETKRRENDLDLNCRGVMCQTGNGVVTPDASKLMNQSECGLKLLDINAKLDAMQHTTNSAQERIISSDSGSSHPCLTSTIVPLAFSENCEPAARSDDPCSQQTISCNQESNMINEVKEEQWVNADSPNSTAGTNESGSDHAAASPDEFVSQEQIEKDKKYSTNSCNALLDFFLMLAWPLL